MIPDLTRSDQIICLLNDQSPSRTLTALLDRERVGILIQVWLPRYKLRLINAHNIIFFTEANLDIRAGPPEGFRVLGFFFFFFCVFFLGSVKNIEKCTAYHHTRNCTNNLVRSLGTDHSFLIHKRRSSMVMNTHSRSQINPEPIVWMELVIQNHPRPPFPPPGGGDHNRIATLEAQMKH
jgi:hypothetical protein